MMVSLVVSCTLIDYEYNLCVRFCKRTDKECKVVNIREKVREARLRWYGHRIRRDEGELVKDIME